MHPAAGGRNVVGEDDGLAGVDGKATGGWTFRLGLGASSSSFERLTQTSTPAGPAVTTGRNPGISASGTGDDQGDITLQGAKASG